MRNILFIISLLIFVNLASCQENKTQKAPETLAKGEHKAMVKEVLQANSYTYLKVDENGQQKWLAVMKQEIKPGISIYFRPDLEMNNFNSKELKRTFDSIFFVSYISTEPMSKGRSPMQSFSSGHTKAEKTENISVKQPDGGISIAQLSANRATYEGKTIFIRGQVTKYNQAIMGKNWVHIQDGTKDGETFDLTITTNDAVKKGDVVTFKGKVVLNKDFGAGYKYDIIMEEARLQ